MKYEQLKAMSDRIKKHRKLIGYTQEQFAEIIELSASSYTKIENAFQKPALDTLVNIAEKMKVSLDYLVFGGDQDKPTVQDVVNTVFEFADVDAINHVREFLNKIVVIETRHWQEPVKKVGHKRKTYRN
jgi:transcriptional regulator with XRE-family HTH domain